LRRIVQADRRGDAGDGHFRKKEGEKSTGIGRKGKIERRKLREGKGRRLLRNQRHPRSKKEGGFVSKKKERVK